MRILRDQKSITLEVGERKTIFFTQILKPPSSFLVVFTFILFIFIFHFVNNAIAFNLVKKELKKDNQSAQWIAVNPIRVLSYHRDTLNWDPYLIALGSQKKRKAMPFITYIYLFFSWCIIMLTPVIKRHPVIRIAIINVGLLLHFLTERDV